MELLKLTKKLHKLTGKLNLHVGLCYQKDRPDIILEEYIKRIKELIAAIETEADC